MTRAAIGLLVLAAVLAGCAAVTTRAPAPAPAPVPEQSAAPPPAAVPPPPVRTAAARPGAYYKDDGPGDNPPANLDATPDAVPRIEPLHRFANNPYTVFGQEYVPMRELRPYRERGVGSWYGRRFHGLPTSSGEPYDMYAMTAAHPVLPIPSYARVTNLDNGRSVVVRINDRGPFMAGRVVDLSFTAASKLGYVGSGSASVEVEAVLPQDARALAQGPGARHGGATTASAARAEAIPISAGTRGVYLQLGAFSARENAENFLSRVRRQLGWLDRAIEILQSDGWFRVHLGPYRDRLEALAIAEHIREALDVTTVFVVR